MESDLLRRAYSVMRGREGPGFGHGRCVERAGGGFLFAVSKGPIVRCRMAELIVGVISW